MNIQHQVESKIEKTAQHLDNYSELYFSGLLLISYISIIIILWLV